MERMTLDLRGTVARALFDELHVPHDQPWDEAPHVHDHYEFMAGVALAALGRRIVEPATTDTAICASCGSIDASKCGCRPESARTANA